MKIKFLILLFFTFNLINLKSQERAWNNYKCAVVLTYDDGLNVHLDKVIPALDARGFKATFYIPCNAQSLDKRLADWRKASAKGHELGNHTIFHPCIGNIKGREWVNPDNDLSKYSINKIVEEIKVANSMLKAVDGKNKRTFAYTCGDKAIGDTSFVNLIENEFVGARNVSLKYENINDIDLMDVGCYVVYNQKADELIEMIKRAKETGTLLVFLFHGVGGEHSINFDENEHKKLLDYLKKNEKDIWIAPLIEVLGYVKNKKMKK